MQKEAWKIFQFFILVVSIYTKPAAAGDRVSDFGLAARCGMSLGV